MSDDHRLVVPGEEPTCGRNASIEAWARYFKWFPDYLIFRRHMSVEGNRVAVLGTTTGSHLALPPEEEMQRSIIWLAEVTDGALSLWQVAEDTPQLRTDLGVAASV
jgi:SnoaL-like domain